MDPSEGENPERLVEQVLQFGETQRRRMSPPDTLYASTGRRLYVLGDIDGGFRPRSNPYDLHAFGAPRPDDPLANRLQGVWAQPVKGLDSFGYAVESSAGRWDLLDAGRFTQAYAWVAFDYRRGDLRVTRRDFAALDLPVLLSRVTLYNAGLRAADLALVFRARFDLQDAWFTHLAERRNAGETVEVEDGILLAKAEVLPDEWVAAATGERLPDEVRLLPESTGELVYRLRLAPGAEQALAFAVAVVEQGGPAAARGLLRAAFSQQEDLLAEKEALYARLLPAPYLETPDAALNAAFPLARANLQMLEAEPPAFGRHFYAGLEIFPFWFSNDGAYSAPGLLASGFAESALSHARIGMRAMEDGRVPHQISPSGRTAFAGNAQETPQWVTSIWDSYRWTGDRAFLAELYPAAVRGLLEYTLATIDPDGDGYPSGPGMVEVEGMGEEKLDSAAYTWEALRALAQMAEVLGDAATADRARQKCQTIAARFEQDWWDEPNGTYAMSLDADNRRRPFPHWAVVTPLEIGLASPDHAAATLATLRAQYLNRWGLKHTVGEDERVWTLPTAALSRAAFRYGQPALGLEMLQKIVATLDHGSIGLFHELIPEGACIVQLWSAAVLVRGVVEDLFGVEVRAGLHRLSVAPRLPAAWTSATLRGLAFGGHIVDIVVEDGKVTVHHRSGPAPLEVQLTQPNGERQNFTLLPNLTLSH